MAVHQRNTASSLTQEPVLISIARVALYARVSTLNGQDPEMQLSELREYVPAAGLDHHRRVRHHGAPARKNRDPTERSSWPTPTGGNSTPCWYGRSIVLVAR